jgi:hypothetical protein
MTRLGFVSHACLSCSHFFQFLFEFVLIVLIFLTGLVLCQEERDFLCALGTSLSLAHMTSLKIV